LFPLKLADKKVSGIDEALDGSQTYCFSLAGSSSNNTKSFENWQQPRGYSTANVGAAARKSGYKVRRF
jgi:hypothetical protein